MIKFLKAVTAVVFLLIAFAVLIIGYEVFGAAYNSYSADKQTKEIIDIIADADDIEILDSYTFSGNSSGTGNHCDLLSLVLVSTENIERIDFKLQKYKYCEILEYDALNEYARRDYENLDLPENTENCYIVRVLNSAPFSDNIIGH